MNIAGLKQKIRHAIRDWMIRKLDQANYDVVKRVKRSQYPGEKNRFEYQKLYNTFHIEPGWVVLDIGGGHDPFPYATVLSDLYPDETSHRSEPLVRDNRPFVVMDVQNIQMPDKSVDFIYCSHVLEHVDDPIKACSELMRVGKRGYIETPAVLSDNLFAWAGKTCHKWHVSAIADTLVFFEYTSRQKEGVRSAAWQDMIFSPYFHPVQEIFRNNPDLFYTMLKWEDRFRAVVFRLDASVQALGLDSASKRDLSAKEPSKHDETHSSS
jgi:SAM-dependent methyltransferase